MSELSSNTSRSEKEKKQQTNKQTKQGNKTSPSLRVQSISGSLLTSPSPLLFPFSVGTCVTCGLLDVGVTVVVGYFTVERKPSMLFKAGKYLVNKALQAALVYRSRLKGCPKMNSWPKRSFKSKCQSLRTILKLKHYHLIYQQAGKASVYFITPLIDF